MLFLLFIAIIALAVIIGKFRSGSWNNLLTFYMLFWGFWIIVSLTNPFGLFAVSRSTYLIILLNLICFSTGFILVVSPKNNFIIKESHFKLIKSKGFLLLQFILLLVLIYYHHKYTSILSTMTAADQRRIVFEIGLLFKSNNEAMFYNWVIVPLLTTSIVILLTNLIIYGQKNIALVIALVNCVLFGLIGNGRLIFFDLLIYFIVAFAFKKSFIKNEKIPKWYIVISIIFAVALIFGMNFITAKRIGLTNPSLIDLWKTFVNYSLQQSIVYFTGGFRALDHFLTSHIVHTTGYTFGRATFAGIEEFFNQIIILITHGYKFTWHTANAITGSFTVPAITIGKNTLFNAFYTCIMNFYLDGGIIGVIILSTLYGAVSAFIYNYCIKDTNLYKLSLLVYYTHHLIISEFRWNFQAPASWIIIFLLILANKIFIKKQKLISYTSYIPRKNKHLKRKGKNLVKF